jgi:uncharacterized protein (TIGR03083 family)
MASSYTRVIPLDWESVRSTCQTTTSRFAELLRKAQDGQAPVPGLDWTVAQLAGHVVSLTARYEPFLEGKGDAFYANMSDMNAEELDAFSHLSLSELADDLERGTSSLLSLCPSGDAPARFFDVESDCASAIALYAEELLVHGLDLARAVGSRWEITRGESVIALAGLIVGMPKFINPQAARGPHVTYEVRLRGGPTFSVAIDNGAATFSPGRAPDADCRISADPIAFLLNGTNRQSRSRTLLAGRMLAFGRKPWLAIRFEKLFVDS